MISQAVSDDYINLFSLHISHDVLFTTFTTIFILLLGYLLNRFNEYRKEIRRLNDLEEYFYSLSEQIRNPVKGQIKSLDELGDEIINNQKNQFVFKDNVNLDINNLLNIQHLDLHKIFIIRKKGEIIKKAEHFTNMMNTLNYIEVLKINARKNLDMFFNEFRIHDGNWGKAYNTIMSNYESFVSANIKNGILKENDNFLSEFDTLLRNWIRYEDTSNIYSALENFIKPLRLICNRHRGDDRAYIILQLINFAETSFKNIDYNKKTYGKRLKDDASYLKSKFESFEEAIKFFRGENGL